MSLKINIRKVGKDNRFECGKLPQESVPSTGAATGRGTGVAPRFPACKGRHQPPGSFGFAGRTKDLQFLIVGTEQHFKFIFTFLTLVFKNRHGCFSIINVLFNLGDEHTNVKHSRLTASQKARMLRYAASFVIAAYAKYAS
jgi:hypothetical protein